MISKFNKNSKEKYITLEKERANRKISWKQLYDAINISQVSMLNKRYGLTEFTLNEAIIIKNILSYEGSIEELFKK